MNDSMCQVLKDARCLLNLETLELTGAFPLHPRILGLPGEPRSSSPRCLSTDVRVSDTGIKLLVDGGCGFRLRNLKLSSSLSC